MICELYINKVIIKIASIANMLNIITKRKKKKQNKTFVRAETPQQVLPAPLPQSSPFLSLLSLFCLRQQHFSPALLDGLLPGFPATSLDPQTLHTREGRGKLLPATARRPLMAPKYLEWSPQTKLSMTCLALSATATLSLPERPSRLGLLACARAHRTHRRATGCSVQDHGSTASFLCLRFQMNRRLFGEPSPGCHT